MTLNLKAQMQCPKVKVMRLRRFSKMTNNLLNRFLQNKSRKEIQDIRIPTILDPNLSQAMISSCLKVIKTYSMATILVIKILNVIRSSIKLQTSII